MRRCQKLIPCPIERVQAGSKTDLPLAKAEPINDRKSASVTTYLRRGKKLLDNSWNRGMRKGGRNSLAPRSVKEGNVVLQVPE